MSLCPCCNTVLEPEWAADHRFCATCFGKECSAQTRRCGRDEPPSFPDRDDRDQ